VYLGSTVSYKQEDFYTNPPAMSDVERAFCSSTLLISTVLVHVLAGMDRAGLGGSRQTSAMPEKTGIPKNHTPPPPLSRISTFRIPGTSPYYLVAFWPKFPLQLKPEPLVPRTMILVLVQYPLTGSPDFAGCPG